MEVTMEVEVVALEAVVRTQQFLHCLRLTAFMISIVTGFMELESSPGYIFTWLLVLTQKLVIRRSFSVMYPVYPYSLTLLFVDIPLVPSLVTGDPEKEPNFILHWLNNKEMHFSIQAEAILNVSLKFECNLK